MGRVIEFRPSACLTAPSEAPTPSEAAAQLLAEPQVTLPLSVVDQLAGYARDCGDDALSDAIEGWLNGEREAVALTLLPPQTIDLSEEA